MRPVKKIRNVALGGLIVAISFCANILFSEQITNEAFASNIPDSKAGEVVRLMANIKVSLVHQDAKEYHYIDVNITGFIQKTNSQFLATSPGSDKSPHSYMRNVVFFRPKNSFCGRIQLKDEIGNIVLPLNDSVNSLNSYPASYSLQSVNQEWIEKSTRKTNEKSAHFLYSGPSMPLGITPPFYQLSAFYLEDYFVITNSGQYQLTVWPKIYKRTATNDDLCDRIDILPVTVPIYLRASTSR